MDADDTEERARILDALRQVIDPEMGESIVDLGLVDVIDIQPFTVHITLVPTSAACPLADVLVEDATAAVQQIYPSKEVGVEVDWGVMWTPQRMSESLRHRFGW